MTKTTQDLKLKSYNLATESIDVIDYVLPSRACHRNHGPIKSFAKPFDDFFRPVADNGSRANLRRDWLLVHQENMT
jgi:hypothetical protein